MRGGKDSPEAGSDIAQEDPVQGLTGQIPQPVEGLAGGSRCIILVAREIAGKMKSDSFTGTLTYWPLVLPAIPPDATAAIDWLIW